MRKILAAFVALISCFDLLAQVAISNPASNPDPSAMLDVKSTTKGFLMPRVVLRTNVVSPATGLLVYETTSNAVWVYNGTAWVQLGSGSSGTDWLANGTHIYNGNTGNVGIGINAPTAKLHLAGLMKIDGGQIDIDDNIAQVRLINGGSPKGYFKLAGSSGNIEIGTYITANDIGKLVLETRGSSRLTILPDGNVGIGTITPDTKFHVVGSSKLEGVVTADQYVGLGNMIILGTIVTNGNIQSNSSMSIVDAAGTFQFKNGADEKGFVQLSGDNLRLGTNAGNTTGKVVIRTGNDDQLFIDQDGNMGFDVSTPLSKIHVLTGNDVSLSSHGYMMLGSVTGSNLIFDNNEIMARSNGAVGNLVLQNDGGTVRIGNVAVPSGYKFAINGKMYCEELRVKLAANWPDYVFNKNYKLLPLSELKKFIEVNNHLPNIPKASVIEKEGMEVGDMQRKLMEKVEELTLYILDLQKQIDALKTKANQNKQ